MSPNECPPATAFDALSIFVVACGAIIFCLAIIAGAVKWIAHDDSDPLSNLARRTRERAGRLLQKILQPRAPTSNEG